jgi:Glycosyl transferases group 1/Nucleotidyl transferase
VRFIWVGDGYGSPLAEEVSSYLSEQIRRSSLGDRFDLMDAVDDIESIYKETDVLFLSSRLDPLPNVSIDAVLRGIPVVCFAQASGMAEILISYDGTRELVVPHLDVGAAAALIGSLAADGKKLSRLGEAVREFAQAHFDMGAYVAALHEMGTRSRQNAEQEVADAALILTYGRRLRRAALSRRACALRLRPLTEKIPKALLEIAGRPFLEHQVELLKRNSISEVILCVGYLGEMIEQRYGAGESLGVRIRYAFDGPKLLGKVGL